MPSGHVSGFIHDCGYESNGEHQHDHGESCGCGCSHGHDHDHAHHDYGEHHHHDHDYQYLHEHEGQHHKNHHGHYHAAPLHDKVDIQNHEGAVVATLKDSLRGTFEEQEAFMAKWLKSLAALIVGSYGVIGHIKASLCSGDKISTFSTTDGIVHTIKANEASTRAEFDPQVGILSTIEYTLIAIVFNVEGDALARMVLESKP